MPARRGVSHLSLRGWAARRAKGSQAQERQQIAGKSACRMWHGSKNGDRHLAEPCSLPTEGYCRVATELYRVITGQEFAHQRMSSGGLAEHDGSDPTTPPVGSTSVPRVVVGLISTLNTRDFRFFRPQISPTTPAPVIRSPHSPASVLDAPIIMKLFLMLARL